jgi:hypothetical protein
MATVAGILRDHVYEHLAYRDLVFLVGEAHRRPEVPESLDGLLGVSDLLAPRIPRIVNDGRISACAVEVGVTVLGRAIAAWRILAREDLAEPVPLDVGHVTDEAQKRHVRRRSRSPGHLFGTKASALEFQRLTAAREEVDQRRLLADRGGLASRVLVGRDKQVRPTEAALSRDVRVKVVSVVIRHSVSLVDHCSTPGPDGRSRPVRRDRGVATDSGIQLNVQRIPHRYHLEMNDIHEDAVRALEGVADALKDAQRALRTAERAARKALRSETRGIPTAAVLRAAPVADYRPDLDEALTNLERARHRVLVANFRVALDDGMTIGELSRNYGFSRQLASRYAKEARDHE